MIAAVLGLLAILVASCHTVPSIASGISQVEVPESSLCAAAFEGRVDGVRQAFEESMDWDDFVNTPCIGRAQPGSTPLYTASQNGFSEVVSMLLARQGVDVNRAMHTGRTPLYVASQNGHTQIVSMLLAKEGVDVNQADIDGATPLYAASKHGRHEVVSLLLDDENINMNQGIHRNGATALFIASQENHWNVVSVLLSYGGVNVNQAMNDGATPLYIASQQGHTKTVSLLLAADGIEVNRARNVGATPLYIACQKGHADIVSLLIAKEGVEVNQADIRDATPLIIASFEGHTKVVSLLLDVEGIKVNQALNDGSTPILIARDKGHKDIVAILRHKGAIIPYQQAYPMSFWLRGAVILTAILTPMYLYPKDAVWIFSLLMMLLIAIWQDMENSRNNQKPYIMSWLQMTCICYAVLSLMLIFPNKHPLYVTFSVVARCIGLASSIFVSVKTWYTRQRATCIKRGAQLDREDAERRQEEQRAKKKEDEKAAQ